MKNLKTPIILVVFAFLTTTCKKSNSDSGSATKIQGFSLADYNGNFLGWQGVPDSDWVFLTSLTPTETTLFSFDTGLSLANTSTSTTVSPVLAYPNPASTSQAFAYNVSDSNVVKLVVVNDALQVLAKSAKKVKGGGAIRIDWSDRTKFPNKTSYRVYFSYSSKDQLDYKMGYGDVRICDGTSTTECF